MLRTIKRIGLTALIIATGFALISVLLIFLSPTYTGKEITWEQALNSNQILVPDNLNWNSTPPTLPDQNGRYKIPKPGITQIS